MRKLIFVLCLVVSVASLTTAPSQPVKAASRCDTVKSLCMGQADMLNQLCLAMGGSTQSCLNDFINYYTNCMSNNDCPINH